MATLNAPAKGHTHSKSASGGLGLPHSASAQTLSSPSLDNAAKFRASMDGPRSVSGGATLGLGRAPGQRPASEMLAMGHMPINPESALR